VAALDLFLLGLASGLALLAASAYRRVSPSWLRWLLIGSSLLLIGRYVAVALLQDPAPSARWWGSALAFILPSAFGVDQLVRHPAMTPKKLLARIAPVLAAGLAAPLFAPWYLLVIQSAWALGFASLAMLLAIKLPSWPIRRALVGLIAGQAAVTVGGLWGEMLLLLALWHAYDTALRA
jgi:hypothetical protein